jgi:hypothetical protein
MIIILQVKPYVWKGTYIEKQTLQDQGRGGG